MFGRGDQAITHIRQCHEDSNQYTPYRGNPDNMTYAPSLRPFERQ
jgi:hypothetical protein